MKYNYNNKKSIRRHHEFKMGGGALHLSLIDPMIDQKNAGIGYFFGVKNGKILAFRVLFLGSVSKG